MAEEEDKASAPGAVNPAATAMALNAAKDGAAAEEARIFLRAQTELTHLQARELRREEKVRHWQLRIQHVSGLMRVAFETCVALLILLIVVGLGGMMWNAARDRDLVMEAFSVPPDVAQSGMNGSALAARVLDRFGAMQGEENLFLLQGAGTYRRDNGDAVRIEIPETGISLGELNHDLRGWLGHETRVTGDLVRTKAGLALTLRYGNKPGKTETGEDLDTLIHKVAEHMYASARPYRYIEYLAAHGRTAEALALAPAVVEQSGGARDRALAYLAWGDSAFLAGDARTCLDKYREAIRLDPRDPLPHAWLGIVESTLQHKEAGLREMREAVAHWQGPQVDQLDLSARDSLPLFFTASADTDNGDLQDALTAWRKLALFNSQESFIGYAAVTAADDHDIAAARALIANIPHQGTQEQSNPSLSFPIFYIAYRSSDWVSALHLGREAMARAAPGRAGAQVDRYLLPLLARAQAENGDIAGAQKLIEGGAADNDRYMEMRGIIAALARHWSEAAHDFSVLSARSPDIPSADTDWGAMLMQQGKFDDAIAKFAVAHGKSPRFADPLEMWGEALIAKNRSDLALAKFEEAGGDAPNWGRLHLKWGEALWWSGRTDEARKQFAIAAGLYLTPQERAQLAGMERV